jgi:tRNA(adenine34) deaminase
MYSNDIKFMKIALKEAKKAYEKDEVPIGAVIVSNNGDIISMAHNFVISLSDPTAHAEILAIRKAAEITNNYRLIGATLYVTIEPCIMCMGAIIHSRIEKIVFGAPDPKWGAAGSLYEFHNDKKLNHNPEILKGIMENECRAIMQDFFKRKREKMLCKNF